MFCPDWVSFPWSSVDKNTNWHMDKIGFIKGEKDEKVKIRPVCNSFTNANIGQTLKWITRLVKATYKIAACKIFIICSKKWMNKKIQPYNKIMK